MLNCFILFTGEGKLLPLSANALLQQLAPDRQGKKENILIRKKNSNDSNSYAQIARTPVSALNGIKLADIMKKEFNFNVILE